MNHDPIVEEIYHHAYAETLFNKARELLCPTCSKILESEAIERYQRMMAKRREQVAALQVKVQKEKGVENRRREIEKNNKQNSPTWRDNE